MHASSRGNSFVWETLAVTQRGLWTVYLTEPCLHSTRCRGERVHALSLSFLRRHVFVRIRGEFLEELLKRWDFCVGAGCALYIICRRKIAELISRALFRLSLFTFTSVSKKTQIAKHRYKIHYIMLSLITYLRCKVRIHQQILDVYLAQLHPRW